ncbi:MFS transporter [Streptomyces sp. CBMA123]|uniref:MFS transporter n=1 Tax=Streptomyces sp. CBMA123 TaxID=1896313 RepID=UPI001661A86D|nr:MFS transporter [Streptomyces sp. CBMA123]
MLDQRRARLFLTIAGVDSFGTGLYTATSVLYFTKVQHFSITSVGLALSAGSITALLASLLLGRVADHYGARPTLIVLFLIRAVGYTLYITASQYWAFFALTCLLSCADRASTPINQALISTVFADRERATVLGTVMAVRNGAIVLGSATATIPVLLDSSALYAVGIAVNGVSFAVAALLLRGLRVPVSLPAGPTERDAAVRSPMRDARFVLITVVNGFLFTHVTILTVVMPLWVTEHTSAPRWALTLVLAVNAVTAMLIQIPLNRRTAGFRPAAHAMAAAGLAVGLSCVLYAGSGTTSAPLVAVGLLVVAVLVHTVGACLHLAGTYLSFELSPSRARSRYLSFFNLGRVGQDLVGPTLLTAALLRHTSYSWWLVGASVAAMGVLPSLLLREPPLPTAEQGPC